VPVAARADYVSGLTHLTNVRGRLAVFGATGAAELQLEPHQQLKTVIQAWPSLLQKYLLPEEAARTSLNFEMAMRRRAFLSVAAERRIRDEVAIKLLCDEAMQRVQESKYPCTEDDLAFLASLRCQLAFGDYNPEVHRQGFLIHTMSDLRDIVPPYMFTATFRRDEFEKRVYSYYATHRGRTDMIVRLLYLQYVRQVHCRTGQGPRRAGLVD